MLRPTLEDAIALACSAHRGQVDKSGEPYILHPLRVMAAMPDDEELRMVALLHDVLEDSPLSAWDLAMVCKYPDTVVTAVELLTRRKGQLYGDYVHACSAHPIARRVKLADVRDHLRAETTHLLNHCQLAKYVHAESVLEGSSSE
jgi:(p)ppGpp synthase/HD superfamily hydrolase